VRRRPTRGGLPHGDFISELQFTGTGTITRVGDKAIRRLVMDNSMSMRSCGYDRGIVPRPRMRFFSAHSPVRAFAPRDGGSPRHRRQKYTDGLRPGASSMQRIPARRLHNEAAATAELNELKQEQWLPIKQLNCQLQLAAHLR
jgi:hypothetical protein